LPILFLILLKSLDVALAMPMFFASLETKYTNSILKASFYSHYFNLFNSKIAEYHFCLTKIT